MITSSPTWCPHPWTTLNIDQTGVVKPCLSSYEYEQDLGNINRSSIQDIIAGPRSQLLRAAIAEGRWDPMCGGCRRLEQSGCSSPRQAARVDDQIVAAVEQDPAWFSLQDLTVNWTNLCNLTCTYCNPETSTAWQAVRGWPITLVRNQHEDLVDLAREHRSTIQGVTLGGGEPLLQRGLLEFLNQLDPDHTQVMITTNLSMTLERNAIYQQLKTWPRVTWMISFDNARADRFEYVRRGATWTQFVHNIKQLQADQQHVLAHPAYSVYCALDLPAYYEFCDSMGLAIYWCDLWNPKPLDARRLPLELRQLAHAEIGRILELYADRQDLSLATLARYQQQLTQEPVGPAQSVQDWHLEQEQLQPYHHTFLELWPEYQ